jgi:hypothetical protein
MSAFDSHDNGLHLEAVREPINSTAGKIAGARQLVRGSRTFFRSSDDPIFTLGVEDFTFAGWFKVNELPNEAWEGSAPLFQIADPTKGFRGIRLRAYVWADRKVAVNLSILQTSQPENPWRLAGHSTFDTITVGEWFWFSCWYHAATNRLYSQLNNHPPRFSTFNPDEPPNLVTNTRLLVGIESLWGSADQPWKHGSIEVDDLGFWRRILLPAERTFLLNLLPYSAWEAQDCAKTPPPGGGPGQPGDNENVPVPPETGNSLLCQLDGYWKMSEASGPRVDIHANRALQSVNGVTKNEGAVFDRDLLQYLIGANGANFGMRTEKKLTISFKVRLLNRTDDQTLMVRGVTGTSLDYLFFYSAGNLFFGASLEGSNSGAGGALLPISHIPAGDWIYVSGWWENPYLWLQVNGTKVRCALWSGVKAPVNAELMIGGASYTNNIAQFASMEIKQVGFWNRVLSATEHGLLASDLKYEQFQNYLCYVDDDPGEIVDDGGGNTNPNDPVIPPDPVKPDEPTIPDDPDPPLSCSFQPFVSDYAWGFPESTDPSEVLPPETISRNQQLVMNEIAQWAEENDLVIEAYGDWFWSYIGGSYPRLSAYFKVDNSVVPNDGIADRYLQMDGAQSLGRHVCVKDATGHSYPNQQHVAYVHCPYGTVGDTSMGVVAAGEFTSLISQVDADNQAWAEAVARANAGLVCVPPHNGDDFETYELGGTGEVMNGGHGWNGPWIFEANPIHGDDGFEQYALGDVPTQYQVVTSSNMVSGFGWDGPWKFYPDLTASLPPGAGADSFEAYSEAGGNLWLSGSGFDGPWIFPFNSGLTEGEDEFEGYDTGVFGVGATVYSGALNYSRFAKWDSIGAGGVDLIGNSFWDFYPGNGLYLDMAGTPGPGEIETKQAFPFVAGQSYRLSLKVGAPKVDGITAAMGISIPNQLSRRIQLTGLGSGNLVTYIYDWVAQTTGETQLKLLEAPLAQEPIPPVPAVSSLTAWDITGTVDLLPMEPEKFKWRRLLLNPGSAIQTKVGHGFRGIAHFGYEPATYPAWPIVVQIKGGSLVAGVPCTIRISYLSDSTPAYHDYVFTGWDTRGVWRTVLFEVDADALKLRIEHISGGPLEIEEIKVSNASGIDFAYFYVWERWANETFPVAPAPPPTLLANANVGLKVDDIKLENRTTGALLLWDDFNTENAQTFASAALNLGSGWAGPWSMQELAPDGFTAYRIQIYANNGDTAFTGILELELYENGVNIAPQGVATASGHQGGGEPAKAIDGSLVSGEGWFIQNSNVWTSVFLDVTFAAKRKLQSYKVGSYSTVTSAAARSANRWDLFGWDGARWVLIHDVQAQTGWTFGELREFSIPQ